MYDGLIGTAPASERSFASNDRAYSESDMADEDELNDILWRAIKGTAPPAPVRSRFGQ